mmetsp:Transcript_3725/g.10274  ORF Transcript_3725/g.10274 Transcript_3725/m.10274 type:complete len:252 (+) Transcript_3725:1165-1920(+)
MAPVVSSYKTLPGWKSRWDIGSPVSGSAYLVWNSARATPTSSQTFSSFLWSLGFALPSLAIYWPKCMPGMAGHTSKSSVCSPSSVCKRMTLCGNASRLSVKRPGNFRNNVSQCSASVGSDATRRCALTCFKQHKSPLPCSALSNQTLPATPTARTTGLGSWRPGKRSRVISTTCAAGQKPPSGTTKLPNCRRPQSPMLLAAVLAKLHPPLPTEDVRLAVDALSRLATDTKRAGAVTEDMARARADRASLTA